MIKHPFNGYHMGLGKIHHVDEIADTGSVRRVVIITKNTQLLSDADTGLRDIGYQILRNTQGQLADLGRRMRPDGIKITKDDAPDGCTGMDEILYDLFINLFCIAVKEKPPA